MKVAVILILIVLISLAVAEIDIEHLLMHDGLLTNPNPTHEPTAEPTALPTTPTKVPSATPSATPSAIPSATPSATPSAIPSAAPSAIPSATPSAIPSAMPSAIPTLQPTPSPTNSYKPTIRPTTRPTAIPTQLNLVAVTVQQNLYGVTPDQYIADRARQNITIQVTISKVLPYVQPENVQNIQLVGANRRLTTTQTSTARVTYNIIFHNNAKTFASVTTDLQVATNNGMMNRYLHETAAYYNVTALATTNVTATSTQPLLKGPGVSEQLTGAEIAGLVIGIILCLGLIVIVAFFAKDVVTSSSASATSEKSASQAQEALTVTDKPADSV